MSSVLADFDRARRTGQPIVAISTPDQRATQAALQKVRTEKEPQATVISWCPVSVEVLHGRDVKLPDVEAIEPAEQLASFLAWAASSTGKVQTLGSGSMVFVVNAHRLVRDVRVATALGAMRDRFKEDRRMVVLLGPQFDFPEELRGDVITLDEEYPSDDAIADILTTLHANTRPPIPLPEKATLARAVDACRGLPPFIVEGVGAMALTKNGLDLDVLWEHKKAAVRTVKGLKLVTDGPTFADIGGQDAIREFMRSKFLRADGTPNPYAPSVIVRLDEVEKMLAGFGGGQGAQDSGVMQRAAGTILTWMEEHGHNGLIAHGVTGSGKSLFARSLAREFGRPCIEWDFPAMLGPYVGETEAALRACLKTIDGIAGGGGAYIVGTCNGFGTLPPEFIRRFRDLSWYFDLPTAEERSAIWPIHLKKLGLPLDSELPNDEGWTGAEIHAACEKARDLDQPLGKVAQWIVPVAVSQARQIERMRAFASGNLLSAAKPGLYQADPDVVTRGRQVTLDDSPTMVVAVMQPGPAPHTAADTVPGTKKGES